MVLLYLIIFLIPHAETVSSIVGGHRADISDFRYLVRIVRHRKFCGGSLISKRAVLTAAHCAESPNPAVYDIRAGRTTLGEIESPTNLRLTAVSVHVNPGYNRSGDEIGSDIAVVLVDPDHTLNVFLKLDFGNLAKVGMLVKLAGWGMQRKGGSISPTLNFLNLHIAPAKLCQRSLYFSEITHLCADSGADGKSGCNGDSGGPLVTSTGVAVGVVSYGERNCYKRGSAFTRISKYSHWIKQIIN